MSVCSIHGGAGAIMSIGLMKRLPIDFIQRCLGDIPSGTGEPSFPILLPLPCATQHGSANMSSLVQMRAYPPETSGLPGMHHTLGSYTGHVRPFWACALTAATIAAYASPHSNSCFRNASSGSAAVKRFPSGLVHSLQQPLQPMLVHIPTDVQNHVQWLGSGPSSARGP